MKFQNPITISIIYEGNTEELFPEQFCFIQWQAIKRQQGGESFWDHHCWGEWAAGLGWTGLGDCNKGIGKVTFLTSHALQGLPRATRSFLAVAGLPERRSPHTWQCHHSSLSKGGAAKYGPQGRGSQSGSPLVSWDAEWPWMMKSWGWAVFLEVEDIISRGHQEERQLSRSHECKKEDPTCTPLESSVRQIQHTHEKQSLL